jgi:hypothetical protein
VEPLGNVVSGSEPTVRAPPSLRHKKLNFFNFYFTLFIARWSNTGPAVALYGPARPAVSIASFACCSTQRAVLSKTFDPSVASLALEEREVRREASCCTPWGSAFTGWHAWVPSS